MILMIIKKLIKIKSIFNLSLCLLFSTRNRLKKTDTNKKIEAKAGEENNKKIPILKLK